MQPECFVVAKVVKMSTEKSLSADQKWKPVAPSVDDLIENSGLDSNQGKYQKEIKFLKDGYCNADTCYFV